jgi:hypothetical protein
VPALTQQGRSAISRVRIEKVISRVAAVFALIYVLQCLPAVFDSARYLSPVGFIGIPIAIYGSILAAAVAAILTRAVRLTAGIQAVTFLVALVLWPLTVRDVTAMGALSPWLWYVITLGMALAAIAFPVVVAALYIGLVPILFAHGPDLDRWVPGDVAEAVLAAATQAMVNSTQHAGSGRAGTTGSGAAAPAREPVRTVSIHPWADRGFTVLVADSGRGFDTASVSADRLGLRVSMRERMAAVGGLVSVKSLPGAGTSIVISWPDAPA